MKEQNAVSQLLQNQKQIQSRWTKQTKQTQNNETNTGHIKRLGTGKQSRSNRQESV